MVYKFDSRKYKFVIVDFDFPVVNSFIRLFISSIQNYKCALFSVIEGQQDFAI